MKTNFEKLFNYRTSQARKNLEQAKKGYEEVLKQFVIDHMSSSKNYKSDLKNALAHERDNLRHEDASDFVDNIMALEGMVAILISGIEDEEFSDMSVEYLQNLKK